MRLFSPIYVLVILKEREREKAITIVPISWSYTLFYSIGLCVCFGGSTFVGIFILVAL
jgi:hypothetical protein